MASCFSRGDPGMRTFYNPLARCFAPIKMFFTFALCALAILTLSRLGLMLWHMDRVLAVDGFWLTLGFGFRIDCTSIAIWIGLPATLTLLISGIPYVNQIWFYLCRIWLMVGICFIAFMEATTPAFIQEYDLRPNRLFVEYLIYPKEVFSMLWEGHRVEIFFSVLVSVLSITLAWYLFGRVTTKQYAQPKWWQRPVVALLVFVISIVVIRSSFSHRPINPSYTAYSNDPLINSLTLNSSYSMVYAARAMKDEVDARNLYPKMTETDIVRQIRDTMELPESQFVSHEFPTMHRQIPFHTVSKPKNLVILLQESLGARFIGSLGGLPLTPEFDHLARTGWSFDRMYATGTRSVRGIEAVVTGFVPTPARSVVKLPRSQNQFFTLASLLKEKNYDTSFIYGGESHFDNMSGFFLGNGFDRVIDSKDYSKPVFQGSWGVSDEDLLNKADQEFNRLSSEGKRFFSLVFSSSNHDPFEFPDGRVTPYEQPLNTRHNAIQYADYAIGEFFRKARKSRYWDDTIFLVVADHDARAYGPDLVPIKNFHIPALILGKDVPPKQDSRIASQIDLPPTLLSLMGLETVHPMTGYDLNLLPMDYKGRAVMQFHQNFAYMRGEDVVILQPGKIPHQFQYSPGDSLKASVLQPELVKAALAYPLWGALAYYNGLYPPSEIDAKYASISNKSLW